MEEVYKIVNLIRENLLMCQFIIHKIINRQSQYDIFFFHIMILYSYVIKKCGKGRGEKMIIVESVSKHVSGENIKHNYIYRLVRSDISLYIQSELSQIQTYGIEVERQDIKDGKIINLERDCVKSISPQRYKVHDLLKILYSNDVSPIHLIEVLGEYIDEYIADFDKCLKDTSSC
ncbi:DUF6514 domain-containing protein [Hathewaya histolytica]|uniref:Uncharacterized protein n=2 Tax=Hathewaya histolytica TaxID=1498 RepID=A0A4U9R4X0_HATHI|nr:Uncharacterised protein [Hathewaya histolytica]